MSPRVARVILGEKGLCFVGKKKTEKNEKVVLFLNGLENCSYHTRYCLYCDPLLCIKTRYCSAQSFALTVPVTVICESDRSFQVARLLYYSIDAKYVLANVSSNLCTTTLSEKKAEYGFSYSVLLTWQRYISLAICMREAKLGTHTYLISLSAHVWLNFQCLKS